MKMCWHKLKSKARSSDATDGDLMANFVDNLDQHSKMLLLLGVGGGGEGAVSWVLTWLLH